MSQEEKRVSLSAFALSAFYRDFQHPLDPAVRRIAFAGMTMIPGLSECHSEQYTYLPGAVLMLPSFLR